MAAGDRNCNFRLLTRMLVVIVVLLSAPAISHAQLSSTFYDSSCPNLQSTVQSAFSSELSQDGRVGASLVRMMFHDCFVQGCDASVLLDDTSNFTGEKNAGPNANSLRGFGSIDNIKSAVESSCPGVVSCADIVVIVARDAVVAAGGPSWTVELGRRDSTTASQGGANNNLPSPDNDQSAVTAKFTAQGLSETDMVTLSGAHTFGKSQCSSLNNRLYNFNGNGSDPTLDSGYLSSLQGSCPQGGSGSTTVDLDQGTPTTFDNSYYTNLLSNKGLFTSDQSMESDGGSTASTVNSFASSQSQFFAQFTSSMINMGRLSPLTGSSGEIRTNCRVVNS